MPSPKQEPKHSTARRAFALVVAAAFVFTLQFLAVHELQHIGDTDSSHCVYAPLAASAGGAVLAAVATLSPPPVAPAAFQVLLVRAPEAPAPSPQARGPPSA